MTFGIPTKLEAGVYKIMVYRSSTSTKAGFLASRYERPFRLDTPIDFHMDAGKLWHG